MKKQFFNNESNAFTHQPLVSHEYNFLYQPIPKCACRTIKTWMILLHKKSDILQQTLSEYGNDIPTGLMYDQFNDKLSKKDIDVHGLCRDIFPTFNSTKKVDNYFKFAFVRNPWIRLAAAYQEKFKHPVHGLYYSNAKRLHDYIFELVGNDKNYFDGDGILSFEAFIEFLWQSSKADNYGVFDVHWMPQWFYIESYMDGECNFIGKIENMETDFKSMIKEINVDFYPDFKIGGTKNLQFYLSMYTNQNMIDKVTEIYKDDIENFGYKFGE